ncbi:uncharacterized protein LOC127749912 [Frankliniella occidentalis]|uniref:Uncharacterized protein LOC113207320 n=1 Tax=Frankliniella occidentalis TaxID=133901 RepID=A0A6J1SEK2_FRAOC|nr:uncharacterized protein LOC113207320 [Frankliniella occidentalis]XP_052125901.1 uncharacterized protein LOC127749912 [Frankliniella occidentalis]
MEQLPDDVLLEVMRYLTVEDLFACRLVCKRLGALALHPDVWRHRDLNAYGDQLKWLCPVLRLAPCLTTLMMDLPTPGCLLACTMVKCAVRELYLGVVDEGGSMHAAALIRSQEALGRLRVLQISFPLGSDREQTALMGTVASTSGLEMLICDHCSPCPASTIARLVQHGAVTTSSLRYFICSLFSQSDYGFAHFVLSLHAATLEKVDLGLGSRLSDDYCPYLSETASLLVGMPNLRKLECPVLPGLESLVVCESLTTLTINVCALPDRRALVGAAKLLRRAHQLREVMLYYRSFFEDRSLLDLGVDLIRALECSGRSQLEKLSLGASWEFAAPPDKIFTLVTPLLATLPSLQALKHLAVDPAPSELLLGITPQTTPALEGLELHPIDDTLLPCAHAWLHSDAVKKLFTNNSSLELFVPNLPKYCPDDELCEVCALGCHLPHWHDVELEKFDLLHGITCSLIPRNKFCS